MLIDRFILEIENKILRIYLGKFAKSNIARILYTYSRRPFRMLDRLLEPKIFITLVTNIDINMPIVFYPEIGYKSGG